MQNVNGRLPAMNDIKNGIPLKAEMYIRRIPMSKIHAEDEEKCAEYLHQLYREKVISSQ